MMLLISMVKAWMLPKTKRQYRMTRPPRCRQARANVVPCSVLDATYRQGACATTARANSVVINLGPKPYPAGRPSWMPTIPKGHMQCQANQ